MTATSEIAGRLPFARDLSAQLRSRLGASLAAGQLVAVMAGVLAGSALAPGSGPPRKAPATAHRPLKTAAKPVIGAQALAGAALDQGQSRVVLQSLMVKAGLRPNFELGQLSWGQAQRLNAAMPLARLPMDAAQPFHLDVDTRDGRQALHCLTQAAYYEAGASGPDAEAAVVQVVLNRVRHPNFPKSICGVVYEGAARASGCQFTFTCDGALNREVDVAAWKSAEVIARRALNGYVVPIVGASTYYHADYVFPTWAPTLVKLATVGPHIFYSMTGSLGRAGALTGRYLGGESKISADVLYAIDALTQRGDGSGRPATLKHPEPGPDGRLHVELASAPAAPEPQPIVVAQAPAAALSTAASAPALDSTAPVLTLASRTPEARPAYFPDARFSHHLPDPFAH
jgi:hypothetical protein